MDLSKESILITGGTGSFGKMAAKILLEDYHARRVVIFSRDELKQAEMAAHPNFAPHRQRMRFFIGDVRDAERLSRAVEGVDYLIHAAALKQVPAAEYNPFEAVKTNILGAQNVINCAIDRGVRRTIALSTDKAANPVNVYGATKLCSDKLFVAGNSYVGARDIRLAVVRYGNVVGSRGSVVPIFLRQRHAGVLTITDPRMTRFWITLAHGVRFVIDCLRDTQGGEVFVPKIPSMKIDELARVIAPEARIEAIGIRPGEKLHEVMVPEDDARSTIELDDRFVVLPLAVEQQKVRDYWTARGKACADDFRYASDTNDDWLTAEGLAEMIGQLDIPEAAAWSAERAS